MGKPLQVDPKKVVVSKFVKSMFADQRRRHDNLLQIQYKVDNELQRI